MADDLHLAQIIQYALITTEWVADELHDTCSRCDTNFNFFFRRHHCRLCGGLFCDACSQDRTELKKIDVSALERVCSFCMKVRKNLKDHPDRVLNFLKRGFAEEYRRKLYRRLSGSSYGEARMGKTYKSLVLNSNSMKSEQIAKDLPRTYKTSFSDIHTSTLGRILRAYQLMDPEVGYCQGLNYIVGFLIHMIGPEYEEDIFWIFSALMNFEPYLFRNFFKGDQLRGYLHICKYVDDYFAEHEPEISATFEELGISCTLFGQNWFHSLFGCDIRPPDISRLWDYIILEGLDGLVRLGLAVCIIEKERLAQASQVEQMMSIIRASHLDNSWEDLLDVAWNLKLTDPPKFKKQGSVYFLKKKRAVCSSATN